MRESSKKIPIKFAIWCKPKQHSHLNSERMKIKPNTQIMIQTSNLFGAQIPLLPHTNIEPQAIRRPSHHIAPTRASHYQTPKKNNEHDMLSGPILSIYVRACMCVCVSAMATGFTKMMDGQSWMGRQRVYVFGYALVCSGDGSLRIAFFVFWNAYCSHRHIYVKICIYNILRWDSR